MGLAKVLPGCTGISALNNNTATFAVVACHRCPTHIALPEADTISCYDAGNIPTTFIPHIKDPKEKEWSSLVCLNLKNVSLFWFSGIFGLDISEETVTPKKQWLRWSVSPLPSDFKWQLQICLKRLTVFWLWFAFERHVRFVFESFFILSRAMSIARFGSQTL